MVASGFLALGLGVVALTALGLRDSPASQKPEWTLIARAGATFVGDARCTGCHRDGGGGGSISDLRPVRDPEWVRAHVRDPEILVPGSRPPLDGAMTAGQAFSVVSYMRRLRAGVGAPPPVSPQLATTSLVVGRYCASCHMLDGEGGSSGPDLTLIGRTRDARWLSEWIADPSAVDPGASMPAFGDVLTQTELSALVSHLTSRK